MNLPNKLTIARVIMVPVFMVFLIFPILPETPSRLIAAGIFILASLTDMLDGKIARKYNLITDLGKFLDPLADKLLVFGGMLSMLVHNREDALFLDIFVWVVFLFLVRELGVTSLRLIAASSRGKVIAAAMLGKIKTVSQMITMLMLLLEPVLITPYLPLPANLLSYICMAVMTVMTVWSGAQYFVSYFHSAD